MRFQSHRNSRRRNHSSVLSTTRAILEKNHHSRCYPLEDIAKALDDTYRNVTRKVRLYKWTALALLTLIPILSTFLSVLISEKDSALKALAPGLPYVSYLLTLLTLLSAIFNPGERFKRVCTISLDLGDLRSEALERLEKLPHSDENAAHKLANHLRNELRPYEKQLVDLFLPETQTKAPSEESKSDEKADHREDQAGRKPSEASVAAAGA